MAEVCAKSALHMGCPLPESFKALSWFIYYVLVINIAWTRKASLFKYKVFSTFLLKDYCTVYNTVYGLHAVILLFINNSNDAIYKNCKLFKWNNAF